MDKKYIQLFKELCKTMTLLAEQVMDYNHSQKDNKGEETAQIMRDDYQKLYDRIEAKDFDSNSLRRADFAKLLVGAVVVMQNLEEQVKQRQKAIQGYKIDLIPKLEKVVNETETTEEALEKAKEIFQISEEV